MEHGSSDASQEHNVSANIFVFDFWSDCGLDVWRLIISDLSEGHGGILGLQKHNEFPNLLVLLVFDFLEGHGSY